MTSEFRGERSHAGGVLSGGRAGFTLIEMLVVISIIALVISMLTAGLSKARVLAKKTQARDTAQQIATAWNSYLNDHRRFPDASVTEMNGYAIQMLSETNAWCEGYMEFSTNEVARGRMEDPWGSVFHVALDNGRGSDGSPYDGKVSTSHGEINGSVAVWSEGPDTEDGTQDDVRTWRGSSAAKAP